MTRRKTPVLAVQHKRALRTTLLQQALILFLTALTPDEGLLFQEARIALLAYWLAWSIIARARPAAPTVWDMRVIRTGYLIIFGLVIIAGPWMWWRLGYWPHPDASMAAHLELGGFLLAVGVIGFASRIPSTPPPDALCGR